MQGDSTHSQEKKKKADRDVIFHVNYSILKQPNARLTPSVQRSASNPRKKRQEYKSRMLPIIFVRRMTKVRGSWTSAAAAGYWSFLKIVPGSLVNNHQQPQRKKTRKQVQSQIGSQPIGREMNSQFCYYFQVPYHQAPPIHCPQGKGKKEWLLMTTPYIFLYFRTPYINCNGIDPPTVGLGLGWF